MMHSLKDMFDSQIETSEGVFGKISDAIFHDHDWAVRYFVVQPEDKSSQEVLLSPRIFDNLDEAGVIHLTVDRERLLQAPVYRRDLPLSRDYETEFHDYYDLPYYWIMEGVIPMTGPGDLTGVPLVEMELEREEQEQEMNSSDDRPEEYLHRYSDVEGMHLQGREGKDSGRLVDFIVQDENWNIMYAVVEVGGMLPGKKVLVSPSLMNFSEWSNGKIVVDISEDTIRESPEYDPDQLNDE